MSCGSRVGMISTVTISIHSTCSVCAYGQVYLPFNLPRLSILANSFFFDSSSQFDFTSVSNFKLDGFFPSLSSHLRGDFILLHLNILIIKHFNNCELM